MKKLISILLLFLIIGCSKEENNDKYLKIGDLTMGENISQNNFCKDVPPKSNGEIFCEIQNPNLDLGIFHKIDRLELRYDIRGNLFSVRAIQVIGVPDGGDSNPSYIKTDEYYKIKYDELVKKYGMEEDALKYSEIISWEKNNAYITKGADIGLFHETVNTSLGLLNIHLIKTTVEAGTYENLLGSTNDVDSPALILLIQFL